MNADQEAVKFRGIAGIDRVTAVYQEPDSGAAVVYEVELIDGTRRLAPPSSWLESRFGLVSAEALGKAPESDGPARLERSDIEDLYGHLGETPDERLGPEVQYLDRRAFE